MPRILVVDDDKKIVRLIKAYLEQAGFTVLAAYDGETALHTIRREKPDLALLDLMLPDHDGWDITRLVRSDPSLAQLPIIMLTARIEDADKIIGLELGADDYITKPFNPREVVARVKSVLRRAGGGAVPSPVYRFGALELNVESHRVTLNGQPVDLTPTEFDLLSILIKNPGRVFSRAELVEQALGYTYTGPERSVDTHIKNLRKKIEGNPGKPQFIQTVHGIGYRLGGN
ncbi:MAG TPA: response regulator transcription factor [Chloroflexi bacterium]|nr:MAG: DNA-binding response regulator [Anaerolineaceae bacterium 4572_5.1]HEY85863.1 response regulator transcription factor [Chloroflexota bacterium]